MTIIQLTLTRCIRKFAPPGVNVGSCFNMSPLLGRVSHVFLVLAVSGCMTMLPANVFARDKVRRDVESYAIASCLAYQQQPYLKDQGDGWASAVVQRSKGDINAFTAVAAAVKTEVAKGDMAVIRNEAGPEPDKTLPIAYCVELLDTPSIHAAIEKAIKKLAGSYKN